MELHKVKSSYMEACGYEVKAQLLRVEFKTSSVWDYIGVPKEQYKVMLESKSVGGYFIQHIRDKYPSFCIQKPSREPSKRSDECRVGTPVYLALIKAEKMGAGNNSFSYLLWAACGKPERGTDTTAGRLYRSCIDLVAEAGGGIIGPEYLQAAIKLASEQKL